MITFGRIYHVEDNYSRKALQQNLRKQGIESRSYRAEKSTGYGVFTNEGNSRDLDALNTMLKAQNDIEEQIAEAPTVYPEQDFTSRLLKAFGLKF